MNIVSGRKDKNMRVELKNIGIVKQSDIELDGLTVITGYNDSGKSTVGKALYSLYHGMNFYQENLKQDSVDYIKVVFRKMVLKNRNAEEFLIYDKIERYIIDYYKKNKIEAEVLDDAGSELFAQLDELVRRTHLSNDSNIKLAMQELKRRLAEINSTEFRKSVKNNTVNRIFEAEFAGKINCVLAREAGSIKISDNDISYEVKVVNNKVLNVEQNIPEILNFDDVVFIDTPMILNYVDDFHPYSSNRGRNSNYELLYKLLYEETKRQNIIEDAIHDEKKNRIIKKINEVLVGDVDYERNNLFYQIEGNTFDVSTLASGLKTYVIIRRLLDNGYLTDKSLLIIDEPEVHLHPHWQLHFAELLVLLSSDLDIKMILTTHSPYFLQALELFSRKYKMQENTHFYLATRTTEGAFFKNIDDNIDETYKLLAEPIIRLKTLLDEQDDET